MVDLLFFFSSRRRHTRYIGDWSSDVCSSELAIEPGDEKHLDGAPKIPVALLKVRSDTSHARAEALNIHCRSEERRVGKECRSRWWRADGKKRASAERRYKGRAHTASASQFDR